MRSATTKQFTCVYLIVSHAQPQAVARLARTLVERSATSWVLIHYDASAGAFPRSLIESLPRTALVDRPVRVTWGTFAQVEAVLRALAQLRGMNVDYDWVTLLSGQDYAARSIPDFETMLSSSQADAIMTYAKIHAVDRHLYDRYNFRYTRLFARELPRLLRARGYYDRIFNRVQPFVRIQTAPRGTFIGRRAIRSIMNFGIPVYKGSTWWALSRKAIDAVEATIAERPDYVNRYARTLSSDESIFQTIVLNTPGLIVKNEELHYTNWNIGKASPELLTLADLPAIRAARQWFVRKIDAAEVGLRDRLDRESTSS